MKFKQFIAHILNDEKAATAVEYGLMVAALVGSVMFTVIGWSNQMNSLLNKISTTLQNNLH